MTRAEELKEKYDLGKHPEGGWFSESYTSPFDLGTRVFMGSILHQRGAFYKYSIFMMRLKDL